MRSPAFRRRAASGLVASTSLTKTLPRSIAAVALPRETSRSGAARNLSRRRPAASAPTDQSASPIRAMLMGQAVNEVVDAELVGLIGFVDGLGTGGREFPEVRNVGVQVGDSHQTLGRIVVLEEPPH